MTSVSQPKRRRWAAASSDMPSSAASFAVELMTSREGSSSWNPPAM